MNYVNASLNWEEIFIQESLELEERMSSLRVDDFQKSRLRIAFDNNILNWNKYQAWFSSQMGCATINPKISSLQLKDLSDQAKKTLTEYRDHDFWNEDLLPVGIWDGHLIVIGLNYNENLAQIPGSIFILAEPFILTFISQNIFTQNLTPPLMSENSYESTSDGATDPGTKSGSLLDGIDLKTNVPNFSFDAAQMVTKPSPNENAAIWDYLSDRHEEYTFEAKKQFSAFVVLRIVNDHTTVFKMDSELQSKIANLDVFNYDLNAENPFKRVLETGASESFSVSQLRSAILDFKYICITALKRGDKTMGFLVGLKSGKLAENDQTLLEDLAKESA